LEQIAGGVPLYMQAGKDGTVIVTDKGPRVVRMPLAKLVDLTLPDQGLHCHRSLWVAKDQVADVVYVNGNPQVKLQGGQYFPVSRKSVADLRACLDAKRGADEA
jgi:DNA-binding LytR/AlgR family response regulator